MKGHDRLTLLIATESTIFRECLVHRLGEEDRFRVTSASTVAEIFSHFRSAPPDLLIADLDALGPLPESLLTRLRSEWPEARILALSESGGDADAARILRAGAMGFFLKREGVKSLLNALHAVARGETWAGRLATARAISEITGSCDRKSPGDLTPRENQLLALLRDGYRNKEIARMLRIEEPTVKAHLHNLFRKLNVRTRVEAALHGEGAAARPSDRKPGALPG